MTGSTNQFMLKMLTNFGDAAVLLPLSVVILAWLLVMRSVKSGIAWLLTLIVCNSLILLLKINFLGCAAGSALHSPSGHTGLSVLVYGTLIIILASDIELGWWRAGIVAFGCALVGMIAISRIVLGFHTVVEVILGALIGGAGLGLFWRVYRRGYGRRGGLIWLMLIMSICAAVFYGQELKIEPYLMNFASGLGMRRFGCV